MRWAQYTAFVPISMKIFADSASAFIADRPDAAPRQLAWAAFEEAGLPTTSDEVWRYAPLKDFDLDRFGVVPNPQRAPIRFSPHNSVSARDSWCAWSTAFCVNTGKGLEGVSVEVVESLAVARRNDLR
jgi:hypothetical protein